MFEVCGLPSKPEHHLGPVAARSHIVDCGCSMISNLELQVLSAAFEVSDFYCSVNLAFEYVPAIQSVKEI